MLSMADGGDEDAAEGRSPLHPPFRPDDDEEKSATLAGDDHDIDYSSDESDGGGDGVGKLTEEEVEILERRRIAELALVDRFDKTTIDPRKECWFLISSKWMR